MLFGHCGSKGQCHHQLCRHQSVYRRDGGICKVIGRGGFCGRGRRVVDTCTCMCTVRGARSSRICKGRCEDLTPGTINQKCRVWQIWRWSISTVPPEPLAPSCAFCLCQSPTQTSCTHKTDLHSPPLVRSRRHQTKGCRCSRLCCH